MNFLGSLLGGGGDDSNGTAAATPATTAAPPIVETVEGGAGMNCANVDHVNINMCAYDTFDQMVDRLKRLELDHPHLAKTGIIGTSVKGRDLVYIKISSGVHNRTLSEPMFKYVGNMHGDEALGRQLLIYLAEYLVRGYENDERARRLVDSTEIFLLPSLNPDGFARSRAGCSFLSR